MSVVSLVKTKDHRKGVYNSLNNIKNDLETKLSILKSLLIKVNFVDVRVE